MKRAPFSDAAPKAFIALFALVSVGISSGCATLFNGEKDTVTITSAPPGAIVTLNQTDTETCPRTPCTIALEHKRSHALRIMLPGFEPFETTLSREIEVGWIVAGLLLWPSLVVDGVSRTWYGLAPDALYVQLEQSGSGRSSHVISPPNSRDLRQSHRMAAHAGLFFPNASGFGLDLNFALYVDADTHLELNGQLYNASYSPGGLEDERSLQAGVQVRHFVGNSFNVRVGGGFRYTSSTVYVPYEELTNPLSDAADVELQTIVATLGVGNQWQWESFTLGIDYFGVSVPIKAGNIRVYDLDTRTPTLDPALRNDVTRLLEGEKSPLWTSALWNVRLLNVHIGAAF